MKYIKQYTVFEASTALTEDQIKWLNSCTKGSWNVNPATGLVDVDYNFHCNQQNLTDFKGVRFGHISSDFDCRDNQLTSLEGAPQTVGRHFYCSFNDLTDLKEAPQMVGGGFYCGENLLTSLEGAPQTVKGDFYCRNNWVSEKTLASIFALMQKGKSYQQALEEFWSDMDDDDRTLMYKDHSSLTPEEIRKYSALATISKIKGYL